MAHRKNHKPDLPSRFPVGTKFVIESRPRGNGRVPVVTRFIEFPDGTFVRLPARPAACDAHVAKRRSSRRARCA